MIKPLQTRLIGRFMVAMILGGMFAAPCVRAATQLEEYQVLLEQGQYKSLLAQLNATLGKKPGKDDQYPLLMLKGEALLRSKASGAAKDAFAAASVVGPDDSSIAIAKGTIVLIKQSGVTQYQPRERAGGAKSLPAAIDILNPTTRKDAFAALLIDMINAIIPKLDKLDSVTSLDTILALGKQGAEIRDVEIAGTGADAQSKELLDKIAARGSAVLNEVLKPMDEQVAAITKDAAKRQKSMGRKQPTVSFSSLSPSDSDELNSLVSQARQIDTAAARLQTIFGDQGDFKTIETDAQKIVIDANKLLTEYHHAAE